MLACYVLLYISIFYCVALDCGYCYAGVVICCPAVLKCMDDSIVMISYWCWCKG